MSDLRFVRPRVFADGVVAVVRHPKTNAQLPAEGVAVDFDDIDARIFFMRREGEGDVSITPIAQPAAPESTSKRASAKGSDAT